MHLKVTKPVRFKANEFRVFLTAPPRRIAAMITCYQVSRWVPPKAFMLPSSRKAGRSAIRFWSLSSLILNVVGLFGRSPRTRQESFVNVYFTAMRQFHKALKDAPQKCLLFHRKVLGLQ